MTSVPPGQAGPFNLEAITRIVDALDPSWRRRNELAKRILSPPASLKGLESLRGKRITLVDDIGAVAALFAPELLTLCWGQVHFLIHEAQSTQQLAREIEATQADIVLMDGNLNGDVRGWDVTRELLRLKATSIVVGFSSDPEFESRFTKAGAFGFVHKRYDDPVACLQAVASLTRPLFSE